MEPGRHRWTWTRRGNGLLFLYTWNTKVLNTRQRRQWKAEDGWIGPFPRTDGTKARRRCPLFQERFHFPIATATIVLERWSKVDVDGVEMYQSFGTAVSKHKKKVNQHTVSQCHTVTQSHSTLCTLAHQHIVSHSTQTSDISTQHTAHSTQKQVSTTVE